MASVESYIGSTDMVAFPWAPRGWALAQGQLIPTPQNMALYYVFGATFGGDLKTTIGLPDLRGRAPIGMGAAPGLTERALGQAVGAESVTLTLDQVPAHEHVVQLGSDPAASPGAGVPAAASASGGGTAPTGVVGGGQPVPTMPPSLAMNWIVCLEGIYPVRY